MIDVDCLTCGWHDDADDLPAGVATAERHQCAGTRLRPTALVPARPRAQLTSEGDGFLEGLVG